MQAEKSIAQQMLEAVNVEREKEGVAPLKLNSKLTMAAQGHSLDMAKEDFFSHLNPNNSTNPASRLDEVEYQWRACGENIAAGNATVADTMTQWMNSTGHRNNILSENFTELGVGYFYLENDEGDVNYYHYWTQVFGRSR